MTRLRKLLGLIGTSNIFGLAATVCVVLALAKLAGVFFGVALLGLLLFYMAWISAGNESDSERIEREQGDVVETAIHEALHAAQLDKEALLAAVRAEVAKAIDQILTEERRVQLQAA